MQLQLDVLRGANEVTVVLQGPFTHETCESVADTIEAELARGTRSLHLDLSGVTTVDDAGLACLEKGDWACHAHGARLRLSPLNCLADIIAASRDAG